MPSRVAVFVDGENFSAEFAPDVARIAAAHGTADLARVYGNVTLLPRWCDRTEFQLIHSGTGKNATDLLLAIDAMEQAMGGTFPVFVIATSDGDFAHLAVRLRERGLGVVGIGEAKAPDRFRAACSEFHEVAKPAPAPRFVFAPNEAVSELDLEIREVIREHTEGPKGMPIARLGPVVSKRCNTRISQLPEKTWRAYLGKRDALFDLDPKGPHAYVRFKPKGFNAARVPVA